MKYICMYIYLYIYTYCHNNNNNNTDPLEIIPSGIYCQTWFKFIPSTGSKNERFKKYAELFTPEITFQYFYFSYDGNIYLKFFVL